jgi:hypothetical protein
MFKKGIVISLCDLTGTFTLPWRENGYRAIHIDPQRIDNDTILEMLPLIRKALRYDKVVFVAGFPPCTDVAVSGARWFKEKENADKHFQAKAAIIAEQCRMIGELSGAPWFFENPVSVFSSIFGKPNYTFHPHHYTGYCINDNYTKKTCLWTGGGFVMPKPFINKSLGYPDDRIHKAPPGIERSNIRSETPLGFSKATFIANKPL